MAVATATALAIAGIASSAAGAAASFGQAANQKKNAMQAQRDAENAMIEARRKLEPNYYAKLAVNKEPYYLQMEAASQEAAQAIEAAREQPRGVAATAGRVQMAINEMGGDIRGAMGKEMSELDRLKAQEDSRLRDIGVQIDLDEAAGQQQMAADAQAAAANATAQGWQGVTSMGQQALQMVPLFPGGGADTAKTVAPATNTTTATPSKMTTQVPSSKLNVSSFQKAPTASQLAQSNLDNSTFQYGQGSKFGSPMKMPLWSDAYNYFKYF